MKTIPLTLATAVRLSLIIDSFQGNRKDLRILGDVRRRIPINDEQLRSYVTPVQGGAQISEKVNELPDVEIQLAPEEARRLMEILDQQTFTVRDLGWVEQLVKDLQSVIDYREEKTNAGSEAQRPRLAPAARAASNR
jgi:hypothetical protein